MKAEKSDEDIIYATDRWLAALAETEKDAAELIGQIEKMVQDFQTLQYATRVSTPVYNDVEKTI